MLHPHGRVSEIQRRQMTTVDSANVHNLAVEGTFDDCQDLVKALFADDALRADLRLSAVNSMNWARLMAQVVYYVVAAVPAAGPRRPGRGVLGAQRELRQRLQRLGGPAHGHARSASCSCASNRNDILTRFFATGVLELGEVVPTISPSMDIQVSSNLERLLFELYGRDARGDHRAAAHASAAEGRAELAETRLAEVDELFDAGAVDDDRTRAAIADWKARAGTVVDPHTAVGLVVAEAQRRDPAAADGVPGHRPPGQVRRCRRGRHRRARRAPAPPRRPPRHGRALRGRPQRPRRGPRQGPRPDRRDRPVLPPDGQDGESDAENGRDWRR